MAYITVDPRWTPANFPIQIRRKIIEDAHPKRGDIIALCAKDDTYRNDGKAIFDGQDIVSLYKELDEYGSVPPTFFIGDEFPIMHWIDSVVHNNIVWIDTMKHRDELLRLKDEIATISTDGEQYWVTYVTFPLGTFKIQVAKANKYGDPDERAEYEDLIDRGEPLPVGAVDDITVTYPWYRTE